MVKYPAVIGYEHQLRGGGARVYTEVGVALVCTDIRISEIKLLMAVDEFLVLGL